MPGKKQNPADPAREPTPPRVALVIGPDSTVAATVAEVLESWEVVRAVSNAAGLEMLRERRYDLVLTGEETSGKEDVELLRQIRIVRPHTRLILLTNESTPADVIAAMRQRAFSYFTQPYAPEAFRRMLLLATTTPVWDEGIEILSATTQWIRLLARCDLETADRLLQFIHEIADLPEEEKGMVGTAFRELLMNAIEHGAHFNATQHVEISYVRAKHMVMCRVKDPGEGFSLEELQHAAVSNPPEDPMLHMAVRDEKGLRPGGFGILVAKNVIDELIYGEHGNDVLLIKYIHKPKLENE